MNLLILSVGTRNKIVQYFKIALAGNGHVIATDCSKYAPALYDADIYYIVPRITDSNYIDTILDICRKEQVSGVLSLIDPELSLLAKNQDKFEAIGAKIIGSSYALCEMTLDKWEMFKWLSSHGYNCAKTYITSKEFYEDIDKGRIAFPVFVKPVCGSASMAITKVSDRETIDLLFNSSDGQMIQEFLDGIEIGADCYIDMISGKLVSVFTKKKIVMRAGETDKSVSFKDPKLFDLIEKFVMDCGFRGQIDIDIFDVNGEYYISEVNPRFGGGYPHAYECGCDHMTLIINNLLGITNEPNIGDYEEDVCMMKYNEIKVMKV